MCFFMNHLLHLLHLLHPKPREFTSLPHPEPTHQSQRIGFDVNTLQLLFGSQDAHLARIQVAEKFNSSPLKNDGWKMSFLLGLPIFRGYVKFQGCRLKKRGVGKRPFLKQIPIKGGEKWEPEMRNKFIR